MRQRNDQHGPRCFRRRRGTTYVLVVGLTALLAAIAVGAIASVRAQARAAALDEAAGEARIYAVSAVELGRLEMAVNPSWRTAHRSDPGGEWFANLPLGRGSITLKVVNPAGDLDRNDTDPVTATGTGVCGPARQAVQVTLSASSKAMSCLDSAVFAAGDINLDSASIVGDGLISSNGNIASTNPGKVAPNLEAAGAISGTGYSGTTLSGAPARTFPTATVFDYYVANGTPIPYASFSAVMTGRGISAAVLTPSSNPYGGGTNAKGIYVVDCGGQDFIIKSARIVGTLVLLNAGPNSSIQNNVNWAPAVDNYPCALVQGQFSLSFDAVALSEIATRVNLNPDGSPYPWGASGGADSDTIDSYPSIVNGLVYASGNISTVGSPSVNQLIAGGTLSTVTRLTINYTSACQVNPPPGFFAVKMIVTPGSWALAPN